MKLSELIKLYPGIEFYSNINKKQVISYLNRYCSIDNLGDCIIFKKICHKEEFRIDFFSTDIQSEIKKVEKIKNVIGNNVCEILFNMEDVDGMDE